MANLIINDVYLPYLTDYTKRNECYYGSAGSGKSHFIAQKLTVKGLNSKRKILVVRKVATTIKDSVFQLFLDILSHLEIIDKCKINLSTFTIELPTGTIILFKGLDNAEKIKSITGITDIWIEEATEITKDEYIQLGLRLRAMLDDCQRIVSFNPISKANWVYTYFGFDTGTIPPDTFILKTTYKDNTRFLKPDYIEFLENLKNTNPTQYKIYTLGEFASLDKLVFPNFKIEEFDYKAINGRRQYGLDFGFAAPTGFSANIVNEEEKRIYIYDEIYKTDLTNKQIADLLIQKGYGKCEIWCDCAEPKSIKELQHYGIYRARASVKGADSVKYGIQKINQYQIIVHPLYCENTINELQNYSYKKIKGTNEYSDEPDKQAGFCHILDALRYSFGNNIKSNRLKVITNIRF